MEGEAVFDSLNLNPQLFINETINTVDDLVDEAFDFFHREASALVKVEGTDRFKDLSDGIGCIKEMIQSVLDKRLQMWEEYCLPNCFALPEGFSLPESNESDDDDQTGQLALYNPELDAQLDSLREKLDLAGMKSAELNSELKALERQSASNGLSAGLVNEALQLYEQTSAHDMFKEMAKTASELRMRMDKLKRRRMEGVERIRTERIQNPSEEFSTKPHGRGLSNAKLEDLQEFLDELKKM